MATLIYIDGGFLQVLNDTLRVVTERASVKWTGREGSDDLPNRAAGRS